MPLAPLPYDFAIEVTDEHIDTLGHVNNVVYLQWVQDATAAHWHTTATPDIKDAFMWVVLRHEIDYHKPAFAGDRIVARTWVGEDKGVRYERFVEFLRPIDGAVLARARSQWCALDAVTQRPTRVSQAVRAPFLDKFPSPQSGA